MELPKERGDGERMGYQSNLISEALPAGKKYRTIRDPFAESRGQLLTVMGRAEFEDHHKD